MTRLLVAFILLALPGCTAIRLFVPSVQNCQHVTYERHLNHVQITADCEI